MDYRAHYLYKKKKQPLKFSLVEICKRQKLYVHNLMMNIYSYEKMRTFLFEPVPLAIICALDPSVQNLKTHLILK